MSTLAYVGDAVNAAGFRLAGLRTWAPEPGEELAAFRAAYCTCDLLLLSASTATCLPRAEIESALASGHPLTVLVPEGIECPLDPSVRVAVQLGLDR